MVVAPGVMRPQWQKFVSALDTLGPAELGRRWEAAKRLIHENGVTYNLYADPLARERPWELDPVPLLVAPGQWQSLAAVAGPAGATAESDSGRSLRAAAAAARGADPGRTAVCPRRVSAALPQFARAAAHLLAPLRGPPGPLDRRTVASAGRSDAGSLGRRLRAGEPDRHLADAAARVSRLPGAAAGDVFHDAARHAPLAGAASSRESADRAAEPRPAQPDLFRRRLPGPLPGLHAGGRRRPGRARLPRLFEDAGRPAAGRRHSAPRLRRRLRPVGTAQRFAVGRAGPGAGGPQRHRGDRQLAGQRTARSAGLVGLSAGAVPLFSGRGFAASQRANLVVRPAERSAATCSSICRSW